MRPARAADRGALQPIIEHWVRGRVSGRLLRNEVAEIVGSLGSQETWHAVALDDSGVLGVMGLTAPGPDVSPFVSTERAGRVVHAFVDPLCLGRGVGSLLASEVEHRAVATGLTELVVRSGPRYARLGWPFWSARYGKPVAIEHADRGNTAVWLKVL